MERIRITYEHLTNGEFNVLRENERKNFDKYFNGVRFKDNRYDHYLEELPLIFEKFIDCILVLTGKFSMANDSDISYLEKIDYIINLTEKNDTDFLTEVEFLIDRLQVYCDYIMDENPFKTFIGNLEKPCLALHRIERSLIKGKIVYTFDYWWYEDYRHFDFEYLGNSNYELTKIIDNNKEIEMSLELNSEEEVYEYFKSYRGRFDSVSNED